MSLSDLTNLDSRKWEDLYFLRKKYAGNPDLQSILAPYEHRAYYREMAQTDPYQAMAMSAVEPAYQAAKLDQQATPTVSKILGSLGHPMIGNMLNSAVNTVLPSDNMTSPPSLAQIIQSWKGISEGLRR